MTCGLQNKTNAMDVIDVQLGDRSYPIYIGKGILGDLGKKVAQYTRSSTVVIVTNSTVAPLYLAPVQKSLTQAGLQSHVVELPDGEEYKSLTWAGKIFDRLVSFKADRRTPLIALGGGVVGDMTGFVAATYMRGVPFIQVPTTLLAQVDSSVGGKTGVNHRKGKNLIGAFYQPGFVYIDIDTLRTLEVRELRAGLAEVIKYGVITDEALFEYLEKNMEGLLTLEAEMLKHIIRRSCEIKAQVVQDDEKETGHRAILNFGHTFGHAVEALTKYREYKHGEAVAIGMVAAAGLSNFMGLCGDEVVERIKKVVIKAGLPWQLPPFQRKAYLTKMTIDKKMVGDSLKFVFTGGIGHVEIREIGVADCAALLQK